MYDRSKTIGASDAVHIWAGEWAALFDRKTSSDAADYPLPAQIGHALEPLNRTLFMQETSLQIQYDEAWAMNPMTHEKHDWIRYLPDGLVTTEGMTIPFEAKAVNMMWKPENLLAKYMPQLQHAMYVTHAPMCYFSVIYLNTRYELTTVEFDPIFMDELLEKEELFYFMLERGIRPPEFQGKRKGWT